MVNLILIILKIIFFSIMIGAGLLLVVDKISGKEISKKKVICLFSFFVLWSIFRVVRVIYAYLTINCT